MRRPPHLRRRPLTVKLLLPEGDVVAESLLHLFVDHQLHTLDGLVEVVLAALDLVLEVLDNLVAFFKDVCIVELPLVAEVGDLLLEVVAAALEAVNLLHRTLLPLLVAADGPLHLLVLVSQALLQPNEVLVELLKALPLRELHQVVELRILQFYLLPKKVLLEIHEPRLFLLAFFAHVLVDDSFFPIYELQDSPFPLHLVLLHVTNTFEIVALVLAKDSAVRAYERSVLNTDDLERLLVDEADLLFIQRVLTHHRLRINAQRCIDP